MSEKKQDEVLDNPEVEKENDSTEETKCSKKKCEKESKTDSKKLKAELDDLKKTLADKEKELSEQSDKYMRVLAEYDNFRRRTQKERDNIYSDAYSDAVKYILPIYDNMERAAQYADSESMAEGISLLLKSFDDAMEKMGITEIEALGKQFDPEIHNAVMHVEDDSYGENEVIEVLQKGFRREDKVIRYAMVKVAN